MGVLMSVKDENKKAKKKKGKKEPAKKKKPVKKKKNKKDKDNTKYLTGKINKIPDKLNSKARKLLALCLALDALPEDLRNETIRKAAISLDGKGLGLAINAFSDSVIFAAESNPDLMELTKPALDQMVEATDFGKLRKAVVAMAEMESQAAIHILEPIIENPVNLANVVSAMPPLINSLTRVLTTALSKVDMPGEILASTVFNLIGAVDKKELGALLTVGAKLINELHQGNYILGGDEPRFKLVFAQTVEELLEALDSEEFGKSIVALAQDGQTIIAVLSEVIFRDPRMFEQVVSVKVDLANVVLGSISKGIAELSKMPDENLKMLAATVDSRLDKKEIGHIAKTFIEFFNRFMKQNPEFCVLDDVIPSIEGEQLANAISGAAKKISKAVTDDPGVKKALTPERVGEKINFHVRNFNQYMEKKTPDTENYLSRLSGAIDGHELEKGMKTLVSMITKGIFSSASTGMALVKTVLSAGWKTTLFILSTVKRKLIG